MKIKTNVVTRYFVIIAKQDGEEKKFYISAETEEAARLKLPSNAEFVRFVTDRDEN